jgi:hypothetical protein
MIYFMDQISFFKYSIYLFQKDEYFFNCGFNGWHVCFGCNFNQYICLLQSLLYEKY